jgi:methyl-accepting chemotaxis protein
LVAQDISTSLGRLKAAMQSLAAGDLTISVLGTDRHDEVSEMAATVQVFQDNANEMQRLKDRRLEAEQRGG